MAKGNEHKFVPDISATRKKGKGVWSCLDCDEQKVFNTIQQAREFAEEEHKAHLHHENTMRHQNSLDAKGNRLKELSMSEVKKTRGIMKEYQSYVTQPFVLPKGKKVLSQWVADAKKRKHLYLTYSDGTTVVMYPDGRRDWFNKKGKLTKTAMLGVVPVYPKKLKAKGVLKGNKLKKRLQKLGYKTDNTNWDMPNQNDDGERWEE